MNDLVTIIPAVTALAYTALIISFTLGWLSLRECKSPTILKVSVVIAFRNEQHNFPRLLDCLGRQTYPHHLVQIILSDDYSDDDSVNIINAFTYSRPEISWLLIPSRGEKGKKAAQNRALAKTTGEIIITCDADCRMGERWLQQIMECFNDDGTQMVIGPVAIDSYSLFSRLQALEFMSLSGTTGGAASLGVPVMCNGANLAYRQRAWQESRPHIKGNHLQSGDDVFLLHAFKKLYPGKIRYLKNKCALVYTNASPDTFSFFQQRIRWAGKSGSYTDMFTLFTAATVAAFNIILSLLLVMSVVNTDLISQALGLLALKLIIDFPLLLMVASFLNQKKLLFLYPVLAIIYPFYVSAVVLGSIMVPVRWKHK
jgi:poly-beta-1,6-N-acetyl-D-glucosamine synthase